MGNLISNPHYTTKQIYDLNVAPQETPESGKLFYWLTFENNNVYANFRIAGESTDRKYQITDPISFNPDVTFSDKVKSISYNQEFSKLVYENEIDSFDVPIIGLINDISYNENTNSLVVKKTNASDIYIKLPDDFKKFVQSGSYNETNKTLVLKYNDNNTFSIDVSKMVKSYTAEQSSTINTVIDESNKILADLKISSEVGNQVQVRSDGIYIPPADGIDFSDFALKSDLNSKVDKITGKGLSTNDFTTELKTKLEGLSNYTLPIASASILGGFKVGEGLRINPETGVLTASVTTAGVTSINELAGNIILEAGENIEITKNGQSITINSTASGNASLDGLLFKIPKIDEAVVYNLYIEFSEDGTFNSTTTYNTTDSSHRSLFKVFTGQQLTDFPDVGVSIPFSDEIVTFDISSIDKSLKYFRFRWNNGFDFGRYGFGKTDGLLQIFDSGSSSSKVEVGTGLSGDGTSGNPLNLDLDSYITTGSISLQGLNIELISDGNFIVKGTSFNIGTSETSIPIVLNGNALNTAGGLVLLGSDGKIPEDLYDKGTLEPTEIKPLLIELNGTNSSSDGIVVSYDNENYLVTITHNLNSYVNGILFDETGKQAFFGIDYVDNNNISIQFSNSTMPTSTSVWKLYLGTQNYNYILSNAIQKNSITTKDIIFEKNTSIYRFIASSATVFTFDISKLDTNNDVNTFEIWIQMNEAQTLTFPSNVEWIDEPDLTNAGLYCFTIRFIPKVWGTMSNNDVIAIMSLSYRIDYTLNN